MFLNRVSEDFDKTIRSIVVQSLVLSLINYCISIWGSTCKTLHDSVQKVQKNFAAKVPIGGARKYDHATHFIKELKWLTINDKYIFEKCTTVYKGIHGLYPYWYIKIPTVSERAASITSQENNLHIPRAKTDSGARATTICGSVSGTIWLIPLDTLETYIVLNLVLKTRNHLLFYSTVYNFSEVLIIFYNVLS